MCFFYVASNFVDLFQVYKLQKNITSYNGQTFSGLISFFPLNSVYYVFQYDGMNALVYNEFWEYQRTVPLLNRPKIAIYEKDELYITSDFDTNKYDKYLNLTFQSIQTSSYVGIYLNRTTGLIYLSDYSKYKIDIFNQSLSLVDSFNTTFLPWFIAEYNGMLAISEDSTGNINFFQNNVLVKTIATACNSRVMSFLFDHFDHMIVLCTNYGNFLIYHTNGTYTGISLKVCDNPVMYIGFDLKDRFVIICRDNINLFY